LDVVECRGLAPSAPRRAVLALLVAATGGAALLLALWLPRLRWVLLYAPCPSLERAPFVLFQVGPAGGPWRSRAAVPPSAAPEGRHRGSSCLPSLPNGLHSKNPESESHCNTRLPPVVPNPSSLCPPQLRDGRAGVVRVHEAQVAGGLPAPGPLLRIATFQHTRYILTAFGASGGTGSDSSAGNGSYAGSKRSGGSRGTGGIAQGLAWAFVPVPRVAPEVASQLHPAAAAVCRGACSAGGVAAAAAPSFHAGPAARAAAAARYEPNVMVVPVPPLLRTLLVSLLHPFCLFQYASVIIWCFEEYYVYSKSFYGALVVLSWRSGGDLHLAGRCSHGSAPPPDFPVVCQFPSLLTPLVGDERAWYLPCKVWQPARRHARATAAA
jgi:hypothetical protein